MRIIHLSDLHLGKRVNEFSMIEDQKYILKQILEIIDAEKPAGVIIAGDVYDKPVPNEDAVRLLNWFLTALASRHLQVYMISGNHDSAVKLAFASELIDLSGIHISPAYHGQIQPLSLEAEGAKVNIYMLPFVKPAVVKNIYKDAEISSYTDALCQAVSKMEIDPMACNILVAHQFVTGAKRSESEEISIGGMDNVDVSVFDAFDYVALGHIHGPQSVGRETVRYCGTPLKYSFSEAGHRKSVTIIEIDPDRKVSIRTKALVPLRDLREIKGLYETIMDKNNYEGTAVEDYIHVTLTDEEDVPNAMERLRVVYPNLMKLSYDNRRTRENKSFTGEVEVERKDPFELFETFYEMQNNCPMSETQRDFMQNCIKKIWGDV